MSESYFRINLGREASICRHELLFQRVIETRVLFFIGLLKEKTCDHEKHLAIGILGRDLSEQEKKVVVALYNRFACVVMASMEREFGTYRTFQTLPTFDGSNAAPTNRSFA